MPDGPATSPRPATPSRPAAPSRRDAFAPLVGNELAGVLRRHEREGFATHEVPAGGVPGPVTVYGDGRARINLGTSNYLGLAGDPRVTEATVDALRRFGTSATGSRVLNGTTTEHLALEEELADFYGTEAAVLTSSGITANVALLSTVCVPGDALLVDAHAHASVHAGAAASRGTVIRFRHNRVESLAARLAKLDPGAGAVVVVDGVYSMTGELAPLAELAALCRRWSVRLVVDEAHGVGVLGELGRGAVEVTGTLGAVDAVTLSLSKALASVGGAVVASRAVCDGIRSGAVPYVFSSANDPSSVAAARATLRILRAEPERMAAVRRNGELLRRYLTEAGATPMPGAGAVVAVPTGTTDATVRSWRCCYDAGVYVNAVAYPARPRDEGVLRLNVMATHSAAQLEHAAGVVAAAVREVRAELAQRNRVADTARPVARPQTADDVAVTAVA